MKILPRDVIGAYKAISKIVGKSNLEIKKAFLLFFFHRMSMLCLDCGLIANDHHKEYLDAFNKMSSNIEKSRVQNYAELFKINAEKAYTDGDQTPVVGYFNILNYAFTFLLNHQNDYINYATDCYLGGMEIYLVDRGVSELENEITNIEKLIKAVDHIEVRSDSYSLLSIGAWAERVPIGQKLSNFL